jgi:hypothetical protein
MLFFFVGFCFSLVQMKSMVGQFPLKGVLAIEFPKDVDVKHAFQIASLDPPFNVKLACDSLDVCCDVM